MASANHIDWIEPGHISPQDRLDLESGANINEMCRQSWILDFQISVSGFMDLASDLRLEPADLRLEPRGPET